MAARTTIVPGVAGLKKPIVLALVVVRRSNPVAGSLVPLSSYALSPSLLFPSSFSLLSCRDQAVVKRGDEVSRCRAG